MSQSDEDQLNGNQLHMMSPEYEKTQDSQKLQQTNSDGIFVLSSEKQLSSKNNSTPSQLDTRNEESKEEAHRISKFNLRDLKHAQELNSLHNEMMDVDVGEADMSGVQEGHGYCLQDPNSGISSNEEESSEMQERDGGANNQYYQKQCKYLQEQVQHLETVNSKLLPDLERQEQDIYQLKEQVQELQQELNEKDRECYNLQ